MDCLKDSGQYVFVPAKLLISMLSNSKISVKDKVLLLNKSFVERASGDALNARYQITRLSKSIICNLLQAYTLTTNDSQATAMETVDFFIGARKMKINAEMNGLWHNHENEEVCCRKQNELKRDY